MLFSIRRIGWRPSRVTLACGLGCAGLAYLGSGTAGALAALVGAAAVLGFFWTAQLPLRVAPLRWPAAALALLLLTYTLRLTAVVAVLRIASDSDVVRGYGHIIGLSVIGCALVWSVTEVLVSTRARTPYVELPPSDEAAREAAGRGGRAFGPR